MVNVTNIGIPQVANRAFLPLAIEAGIESVIQSIVTLAMDKKTLLIRLVEALEDSNPELAAALNIDTLDAILAYMMSQAKTPVVFAGNLPMMLNEDGPASVTAARDGGDPTQVNVTFSDRPAGYKYAIYLDGIFQHVGNLAATDGFVNEAIMGITPDGNPHTIRVLFVSPELATTRFGPIATI